MDNIFKNRKGFTLLELIIVVGIAVTLIAVIVPGLSTFRNNQALKNDAEQIVSLLNKAHSDTLSSLNSSVYGVHIESDRVVYYMGSSFSEPNASNISYSLNNNVTIPTSGGISLNGGSVNVVFERLTGDTNNYGTIILRLSSDATKQSTITINKTGVVSVN